MEILFQIQDIKLHIYHINHHEADIVNSGDNFDKITTPSSAVEDLLMIKCPSNLEACIVVQICLHTIIGNMLKSVTQPIAIYRIASGT